MGASKICSCGTLNPAQARFCRMCGRSLDPGTRADLNRVAQGFRCAGVGDTLQASSGSCCS